MAAILLLRRGTSFTSPRESELFYNSSAQTLLVGITGSSHIRLAKVDGVNTGSFSITGDLTASNALLSGDIRIGGNIYLGDELANDNINVNASFSGSLIPETDSEFDLGSQTRKWNNLYVVSASIEDIQVPGSGILSSSITNFTDYSSSVDTRLDASESTGSNHRPRIVDLESTGSDQETRIDTIETTFSSSVDIRLDYLEGEFSSSVDFRLDSLETDTGSQDFRLDRLEEATASLDGRLDNVELTTESFDNRLDNLETTTASFDDRLDNIETTTQSFDSRLDNLELTSQSHDDRLDNIESTTSSFDSRIVDLESTGSDHENRVVDLESTGSDHETRLVASELTGSNHRPRIVDLESTGSDHENRVVDLESTGSNDRARIITLESTGSDHETRLDTLEGPFSTSVDSRLDSLESDSHTHSNKTELDTINQNLSTTDNVTFADGDFTGDVQVTGNLTVLGSATEIQTSELRITDKLITVASGSADSAAADGAGIEIDGANKSLIWDHNTSQFVFDAQVSSSIGFKGEGGELTGIDTDQVTEATNLYYTDLRVKSKLDTEGVLSGSAQLTTEFDTRYLNTDGDNVISSSQQVVLNDADKTGFDTDDVVEGTNLYYTDLRVKSKLDTEGVISGSSQITITESQISDLDHYTDSDVKTKLDVEGVLSGSEQVNADSITNFDTNVKSKLDTDGVISGSSQLTTEFDTRYLNTDGDNVISGSIQVDVTQTTNYASINQYADSKVKSKLDTDGIFSSSAQVNADSITNFDTNVKDKLNNDGVLSGSNFISETQGSFTASINDFNTNIDLGLEITDSPTFNGITLSNLTELSTSIYDSVFVNGSGVLGYRTLGNAAFYNVSSSVGNDPNSIPTNAAVDAALVAAGAGDITAVNDSSIYSSTNTGIKHTTQGTETGGEYGQQGNIVLAIDTGSNHFVNAVQGISPSLPIGLISGSEQVDADSITNFDTNVKSKLDTDGVHSGSFLGTATTSNLSEGLNFYYTDTRVLEYINSIAVQSGSDAPSYTDSDNLDYLNSLGVISGSSQITITESQISDLSHYGDSDVKTKLDVEEVVSGSSQVSLSGLSDYDANDHIDHSTITIGSGKGLSGGGSIVTSRSLTLDTGSVHFQEGVELYSSNLTLPAGTVSGSIQVDVTQTTNYNSINQYTDSDNTDHLNSLGVHSGSAQVVLNDANKTGFDTADVAEGTNLYYTDARVKTKLDAEAVLSGSSHSGNHTFNDNVVISGDLDVAGTTTYTSTNNVQIGDNIIELNFGGSAGEGGILVKDATGTTTSGSLLWDSADDKWIAGGLGSESPIVRDIDLNYYTDLDNTTHLNSLGVVSGSSQTIKNLPAGIVSGSQSNARGQLGLDTGDDVIFSSIVSTTTSNSIKVGNTSSTHLSIGHNSVNRLDENGNQDGYVYIQNAGTTQTNILRIGNYATITGTAQSSNTSSGALIVAGGVGIAKTLNVGEDIIAYASSDERLKDEIIPISNPLEKINSIGGYSFLWNEEKQNIYKGKDYGVIAQEIEKVLPELVQTRDDGYKAVKYDKVISLLIEGIKELSNEVEELKKIK